MTREEADNLVNGVKLILKKYKLYDRWKANKNDECENCGYQQENDFSDGMWAMAKAVYESEPKKALTVQIPNEHQNINQNAFNEWMAYKKYKNKGAITKTLNMLNKYDFQTQQEMVDLSIGNEYKGLFPPKQSKQQMQSFKQQDEAHTRNVVNSYLDSGYSLRGSHSDNDIDVKEITYD